MLEGGGEVEHGPGQDDVVVGAQEEGDHHGAHPRPPQDGAQPVQGACRDIWLSSDPSNVHYLYLWALASCTDPPPAP